MRHLLANFVMPARLAQPSRLRSLAVGLLLLAVASGSIAQTVCLQTVYLTFDTGSQSQTELIASLLKKHRIKATFFLANEKTTRGDYSLDASWANYWKQLVQEGHAFGSHTFDHVYLKSNTSNLSNKASKASQSNYFTVKPQFGPRAGQLLEWSGEQYCAELNRVKTHFQSLTGHTLSALWRAPGGHVSAASLAAAAQCGYQHVGWQTAGAGAGFLGDELNSTQFPNSALLKKALTHLKDGDVAMAHLGIWSRRDAWAPAVLEPLITGLKAKGTCFATLLEHPQFGSGKALQTTLKF